MTKPFNWKLFIILAVAVTVGLIAVIPYSLALQGPDALAQAAAQTRMPLPLLLDGPNRLAGAGLRHRNRHRALVRQLRRPGTADPGGVVAQGSGERASQDPELREGPIPVPRGTGARSEKRSVPFSRSASFSESSAQC